MPDHHPSRPDIPATTPQAASGTRWRLLAELIRRGDSGAISRVLSQSPELPSAHDFATWSALSLPDHPATAHLLADYALDADIALPSAHLAKAHASAATGDPAAALEHYHLAKAIDPAISDPAFEIPEGTDGHDAPDHDPYQDAPEGADEVAEAADEAEVTPDPASTLGLIPLRSQWHLSTVLELQPHAPLIDPALIPPIHRPNIQKIESKPAALKCAAAENPALTRSAPVPLIPKPDTGLHPTLPEDHPQHFPGDHSPDEVVLLVADPGTVPKLPERNATKERLSATLTTILIHIAIGILLAVLIISIPDPKPTEIIAITSTQSRTEAVRKKISRAVVGNPSPPSLSSLAVIAAATSSEVAAPTVQFDIPQDSLNLGTSFGSGGSFGGGLGSGGTFGVPAAMKSRCDPQERNAMLAKHGGSRATEAAVIKGLNWIAQQQNKDGSWGKNYKCAMTGLALLAFLGHCETPDSERYGNRVMRGILFLVEQSKKGNIIASSTNHAASYEHGIATYALGESYAIARLGKRPLPGMREAFMKGTKTIIQGQNPDGGWSYGYPKSGASDTSVTGWQYQALKAAKHTKIKIDGLDAAIEKAQAFLANVQDRNTGGFPYRPGQPGRRSLTSAGVLGLQMLGGESKYADNIERGLRFALGDLHEQSWRNADFYTWYYNTQACFQHGGNPWQHWNNMFSRTLVLNQAFDGAWDGSKGNHAGADAHFYSTCLAVLMLEVYYRYLPASG